MCLNSNSSLTVTSTEGQSKTFVSYLLLCLWMEECPARYWWLMYMEQWWGTCLKDAFKGGVRTSLSNALWMAKYSYSKRRYKDFPRDVWAWVALRECISRSFICRGPIAQRWSTWRHSRFSHELCSYLSFYFLSHLGFCLCYWETFFSGSGC